MNRLVPLLAAAAVTISAPAAAQDAAGDWAGALELGPGARLPLVVHISRDDAGALTGTLDSPAQGATGMPLAEIAVVEGLRFKVPAVSGEYSGTWNAEAKAWQGEWRQAGMSWPLRLAVPPPPPPLPADWQLPSDAEIGELIAARNGPRAGQGIVVGVFGPDGRRIVAGGSGSGAAFDGTTLFEIGSISKVFTALILADMVNKGEVMLDEPAAKYLPSGHTMPERNGRQLTLRDLATHRSGLPRMADNMGSITDPDGPFADYTEEGLLAFLDRYQLTRDIGSQWEYSNVGMGLVGYLLARAAGSDYETLLRERITGPLGMDDTAVTLTPDQTTRFAPPYDGYMRPAEPWTFPTLMGAGGIRSTAADMLEFAAAVLDPDSPLAPAVRTALSVRMPASSPQVEQALGWLILHPRPGRELLEHDGGTGGFRSMLALEPSKGRAVVALINSAAEPGAVDFGLHVLIGSPVAPTPPVPPPPLRTEVSLPVAELERVVGRYELGPELTLTVERQGEGLTALLTGQAAYPIFAEAPLEFFWRVVDAQLRFTTDESGKVTGLALTQGGQELVGKRIEP